VGRGESNGTSVPRAGIGCGSELTCAMNATPGVSWDSTATSQPERMRAFPLPVFAIPFAQSSDFPRQTCRYRAIEPSTRINSGSNRCTEPDLASADTEQALAFPSSCFRWLTPPAQEATTVVSVPGDETGGSSVFGRHRSGIVIEVWAMSHHCQHTLNSKNRDREHSRRWNPQNRL
jgi:hypothetical protein